MTSRQDPKTVALGKLIELLAMTDPLGIRRLEGLSPAPDWVDLVEAIQEAPPAKLPVKIPRGNMTEAERRVIIMEKIEAVLSVCDGWAAVLAAVQEFKRQSPHRWQGFKDYVGVRTAPVKFVSVEEIAERHHVNPVTLWKWQSQIPLMLGHLARVMEPSPVATGP